MGVWRRSDWGLCLCVAFGEGRSLIVWWLVRVMCAWFSGSVYGCGARGGEGLKCFLLLIYCLCVYPADWGRSVTRVGCWGGGAG